MANESNTDLEIKGSDSERAVSANSSPYEEFGTTVKRWRSNKYRSALSFWEQAGLSISYGAYAAIERGDDLPSPALVKEIAEKLSVGVEEAMLLWAKVQMHAPELRALFASRATFLAAQDAKRQKASILEEIDSNNIPPSGFDNTWVFQADALPVLEQKEWLMDLLILMATAFPGEVLFSALGLSSGDQIEKFIEEHMRLWVDQGYIIASATGIRLSMPYIHLPKQDKWQEVRMGIIRRTLEALLPQMTVDNMKQRLVQRSVFHKRMSEAQRDHWVRRLAELEMELQLMSDDEAGALQKPYAYVVLFGEAAFEGRVNLPDSP